jgi:hypothetical protein
MDGQLVFILASPPTGHQQAAARTACTITRTGRYIAKLLYVRFAVFPVTLCGEILLPQSSQSPQRA